MLPLADAIPAYVKDVTIYMEAGDAGWRYAIELARSSCWSAATRTGDAGSI
jgi:hypothetical protein